MKKLIYTIFILSAFSILSASHVYAENEDSDSEIVTPDMIIDAQNIILTWGDIPFLDGNTIKSLVEAHFKNKNILTLASRYVD